MLKFISYCGEVGSIVLIDFNSRHFSSLVPTITKRIKQLFIQCISNITQPINEFNT